MPTIEAKADNLNDLNGKFDQIPLQTPIFLNSVPKSGTHLLRNIVRMFAPVEQQYHEAFIQIPILGQHIGAFDKSQPKLSWGHLLFSDNSAMALRQVKHIVLVRDPYDWVLARARFFLSDTFKGSLEHLKGGNVSIDEVLNMMILGIHGKSPSLEDIYVHNAVGWLGTKATIVKYEDLCGFVLNLDSNESFEFFSELFGSMDLSDLPTDWKQRITIGADRNQSGTARENLSNAIDVIPNELPEIQKKLINFVVPGLRELLGYKD